MNVTTNYLRNLWDLEKHFSDYLENRVVEMCPHVEKIGKISPEEFESKYVEGSMPVLLNDETKDWPAITHWDNGFFKRECGDIRVNQFLYDPKKCHEISVAEVIEKIESADEVAYIQEWWAEVDFPEIRDYFSVPEYFKNDWHSRLFEKLPMHIWIGSKNSTTPIHQDGIGINVWTAQIKGVKRWILCDKEAKLHTLPNGEPDIDRFLNDPATKICYCDVQPGEILFNPSSWWHRIRCLSSSISINTQYVTDDLCVPYIQRILQILLSLSLEDKEAVKAKNPTLFNAYVARAKIWQEFMDQSSAPKISY